MYGVLRRGLLIGVLVVALATAASAASAASAGKSPTKGEALKFTRAYVQAYTHKRFLTVCHMASAAYLQGKTARACAKQASRNYDPHAKFWSALRSGYTITKATLTAGDPELFGYPFWTYTMFFKSGKYRASLVVKLVRPGYQLRYLSVASGSG